MRGPQTALGSSPRFADGNLAMAVKLVAEEAK